MSLTSKAVAALETSVVLILGSDEDAATKRSELAETFGQFAEYIERNVGKQRDDGGDDDDDDDAELEKGADHPASTVAGLLVEAGSFPDRATALHYLLRKPGGQALLARMHKKETTPMSTAQHLESILKDLGPVRLCKGIVDRGRAPCDEAALVAALTKNAGSDRAFAKLYESEESVRRACSIAKAAEFAVFDDTPAVVGGADARDVDNATAATRAYEEIVRIGREKFPFLPADVQFARVFEDKNYIALARQARWYSAPDSSQGAAYSKSDPAPNADSAYGELMLKAEAYRDAHPELSIAQCFEKVFTAPANRELAKRERRESASW
jgi:hypothetical protein